MKTRVLVHGAENFVGQRLVATLAAGDWAAPQPVTTMDLAGLRQAIQTAQAIVHCVVGAARSIERGAQTLYGLLAEARSRARVIHLSSMTVYGSTSGLIEEGSELRADLGPYSSAQRGAEALAAAYPDAVILRPGAEYGCGCPHWSARVARLLLARRLGDLGAAGDGCCNLLYIDDLITAIQRALQSPPLEQRCFNLAGSSTLTWNEYFVAFAIALGAVPVRRIDARRLRLETGLLAPVLKAAELAARAVHLPAQRLPPPISSSMLAVCRQEIRLAVGRAEALLGMQWTHLDQGLERTAAWYRRSEGSLAGASAADAR